MQGEQSEEAPSVTLEPAATLDLVGDPAGDLRGGRSRRRRSADRSSRFRRHRRMLAALAETTPAAPIEHPRGRPGRWLAFTLAVLLVFVGVVMALNSSLYSASGFVERYLDALQRRDVGSAETMAGVVRPEGSLRRGIDP